MTMQELLRRQNEMSRTAAPVVQAGVERGAAPVAAISKDIQNLTHTITQIDSANDEKFKERQKKEEELTDTLKKLIGVIREQIKKGLGEVVGKNIGKKESALMQHAGASSGLRQLLLGGKSSEEVKQSSIFGVSAFIDKKLSQREEKYALKVEKKQYVEDAIKNDPTSYAREANFKGGLKTAEGRAVAEASAGKRFDAIKEKEKEVTKFQEKIESAEEAGFAPLKKNIKGRDKATEELALIDTRIQAQLKEETPEKQVEEKPKVKSKKVANQTQQVENTSNVIEFPNDPAAHAIPANVIENTGAEALQPAVAPVATAVPVGQPAVAPVGQPAVAPVATAVPVGQPTTMGAGAKQTAALFLPPTPTQTLGQPDTVGAQAQLQAQLQAPIQAQIQAPIQAQIPQVDASQLAVPEVLQQRTEEQNETWKEEEKEAAALSLANDKEIGITLSKSLGIQKQQLEELIKISESGGAAGGGGAGGGLIDNAIDVATSLPGKAGAAGGVVKGATKAAAGFGGKAMNFLKGPGGKILGATAAVGMGAYEAYSGWQDANKDQAASNQAIEGQVASGEITEEEGKKRKAQIEDKTDVKKGEAVGGGAGGAGGALAGAAAGAAIGSAVPIIGTAIGGVVGGIAGYYGGSAIGSKVGGALTSGYKSVKGMFGFGGDDKAGGNVLPPGQNATEDGEYATMNPIQKAELAMKSLEAKEPGFEKTPEGIKVTDKRFLRKGQSVSTMNYESTTSSTGGGVDVKPLNDAAPSLGAPPSNVSSAGPSGSGQLLQNASRSNADLKADKESKANNIIVNAPTTNNSGGNQNKAPDIRAPLRNQESTVNTYINSRFL